MRQGSNGRRPRGRPNRKQHGNPGRSNTFDSNGPEGRIRGNAHQVYEKYLGLARDAASSGDRIAAEAFYQHAEHYFRIVNDSTDPGPPEGSGETRDRGDARGGRQRSGNGAREPRVNGGGVQPEVEFPGEVAGAEVASPAMESSEAATETVSSEEADGEETKRRRPEGGRPRRRGRPPRNAAQSKEAAAAAEPDAAPAPAEGDDTAGKTSDSETAPA